MDEGGLAARSRHVRVYFWGAVLIAVAAALWSGRPRGAAMLPTPRPPSLAASTAR